MYNYIIINQLRFVNFWKLYAALHYGRGGTQIAIHILYEILLEGIPLCALLYVERGYH